MPLFLLDIAVVSQLSVTTLQLLLTIFSLLVIQSARSPGTHVRHFESYGLFL